MKKLILYSIVLFAAALAVMAFTYPSGKIINPAQEKVEPVFPKAVQKILETSCFDCHSDVSSNEKAKLKINFSKWNKLSDSKKVGKMENISEIVKKGDMPPAKYLTKYPDRTLGQEQKDVISTWVTEESARLMGN